jgi:hypothetical protein
MLRAGIVACLGKGQHQIMINRPEGIARSSCAYRRPQSGNGDVGLYACHHRWPVSGWRDMLLYARRQFVRWSARHEVDRKSSARQHVGCLFAHKA